MESQTNRQINDSGTRSILSRKIEITEDLQEQLIKKIVENICNTYFTKISLAFFHVNYALHGERA